MNTFFLVILVLLFLYIVLYIFFSRRVKKEESILLDLYIHKISKVPALIEVMRPHIVKSESFDPIIELHTRSMVEASESIYDVLTNNAALHNEFLFLMKLSVHARALQKNEYFVYIRDFIIEYEKLMHDRFGIVNREIELWNSFVRIKNMTLIGFLLPGREKPSILAI